MAERTCTVDGCERPHCARGLCVTHYDAARRSGRLELLPLRHPPRKPCACGCGQLARYGCEYIRAHRVALGVDRRTCTVEGCSRPTRGGSRAYCPKHYRRWRNYGDPLMVKQPKDDRPYEVWFWERVAKGDPDECWLWTGHLGSGGYGAAYVRGVRTNRGAHRVAYELAVGPVPDGLEIDHLCFTRRCCNPAHLEPVTHAENVRRSYERHRACKREG